MSGTSFMKILGISGFADSIRFKRTHWPSLSEREYRIVQGLDSAAALLVDGELVAAAAEERFNRKKHSGDFPSGAISYCLAEAGLSLDALDEVVHGFDYRPHKLSYSLDPISARLYREILSREAVVGQVRQRLDGFPSQRVYHVEHHLAHAASAYFCSGWEECLALVIDGMGETQSASVYRARAGKLEKLVELPARDSIGILYSVVTLHLGFDFNADEYKIMGLAPYGDPARFRRFFEEAVVLAPDGGMRIPLLRLNRTYDERERHLATRAVLGTELCRPRRPDEEIADVHRDVAAALQEALDRTLLHLCGHFAATTGQRRLALAGGVALNCTANGKLLASGTFDEIYIQPAASDDGSALGATLHRAALAGEVKNERLPVPFLGPSHGEAEIDDALLGYRDRVQSLHFDSLDATCAEAARLIADGHVIAWYRGRMEFGPRALGHG